MIRSLASALPATGSVDPVVLQSTVDWSLNALVNILGLSLFAVITAMGLAFAYRAFTTRPIPIGVAVVLAVAFVGLRLTVEGIVDDAIIGTTSLFHYGTGAYLLGVISVSTVGAEVGRRVGDHFASDVFNITTIEADTEVADTVRSSGLVTEVRVPEHVEDLDGYPVVDDEVKRELAGERFVVPLRLTGEELRSRLVRRIERDYAVEYAHLELDEDDGIEYLAVGGRRSGLGPTLPPGTVAVAIEADPAPSASPGEPVELWADDGQSLVTTGVFRASVGDVATVVVEDPAAVDADERYRLVTRPDAPEDVDAFASVIRRVDETVTALTVEDDGPLEGEFVGWLPVPVLAIDRGEPVPFPPENETLRAGDVVYVLGSPETLHGLAEYERERDRPDDGLQSSTPELSADD